MNRTMPGGFWFSPDKLSSNQPTENSPNSQRPKNNITNENLDIKSYEAFWDAILDDDNTNKSISKISQQKSISERNNTWLDKKNDKINQQKQIRQNKIMAECSFKPFLMTKNLQDQMKNTDKMHSKYENHTKEQSVNDHMNYVNLISERNYAGNFERRHSMKAFKGNGGINRSKEEEFEIQKKLYSYILDTERDEEMN